ncbi:hypothetical protein BB558_000148 [Smittium angustum]|uniref:PhoD-like phosphatase metallophosphatase domain-containing protein n=1 Tax=Smittium angustum TaxID=133377 RepID=A0A2U1JF13_SMIAN|nr:hypothetical protein BB558_000148 [Smittium angustum]
MILAIIEIRKPVAIVTEKDNNFNRNSTKEPSKNQRISNKTEAEGLRQRKPKAEENEKPDVNETVQEILAKDRKHNKPLLKMWTIINIVLFYFVVDFTFRPLVEPENDLVFYRLGYVGPNSAKISFRLPPQAFKSFYNGDKTQENGNADLLDNEITIRYIEIKNKGEIPEQSNAQWVKIETINTPNLDTDYTGVYEITDLSPSKLYHVQILQKTDNEIIGDLELKTTPENGNPTKFKFGTGSCIKPNFPYIPGSKPHLEGFRKMATHDMDMIMFLGDFVYADCPYYYGSKLEDYRRLYRQVYTTEDTKNLVQKTPMLHIYDDHEIIDNWSLKKQGPYENAMKAYWEYNGAANPKSEISNVFYYNFTRGDVAFYVWDTRGHRDHPDVLDTPQKTMLGEVQKVHFMQWAKDVNHTAAVKFVVSSTPLAYVWDSSDAYKDTWKGYQNERNEILNVTMYIPNLHFLSGDRHEVAVVELSSMNMEFSTSPVNQFSLPRVNKHVSEWGGDVTKYYHQPGQIKFAVIEVDTETSPDEPVVKYNLYSNSHEDAQEPVYSLNVPGKKWK